MQDIKPRRCHRSGVYGAWLWVVPTNTSLESTKDVPEEDWELLRMEYGVFRSLNKVKHLLAELLPGTYVIGIGMGKTMKCGLYVVK